MHVQTAPADPIVRSRLFLQGKCTNITNMGPCKQCGLLAAHSL